MQVVRKYSFLLALVYISLEAKKHTVIQEKSGIVAKSAIAQFLPKNPIILEAGAHVGYDTVEMARYWPGSKIYAFEPVPTLFSVLQENTKAYPNIRCFSYALSASCGMQKLYVSSGTSDGSSSLLEPKDHLSFHPTVLFNEHVDVTSITIDDWARNQGITKIDFMWLDLQGFEPDVLRASPYILSTVKVIYTEVNLIENYKGAMKYQGFKDWLEQQGFEVVIEAIPWGDAGNVLFVRSDLV